MRKTLIILLLLISSSIAQAVTINFKAHNRNGYPLPLKSVQIIHEEGGLDTTLTEEPFDVDLSGFVIDVNDGEQGTFYVSKAYPNSFDERTQFNVSIPQVSFTKVEIVSARGDIVAESSSYLNSGNYTYTFEGGGLPAGLYLARISSGTNSETLKLVKAASGGGNMGTLSYWGNSAPKLEVKDYGGFKFIGRVAGSPEAVIDSAVISNGQEIDFEIDTDTEWAFSGAKITFQNVRFKENFEWSEKNGYYDKGRNGVIKSNMDTSFAYSFFKNNGIDYDFSTEDCSKYYFIEDSLILCYMDYYEGHENKETERYAKLEKFQTNLASNHKLINNTSIRHNYYYELYTSSGGPTSVNSIREYLDINISAGLKYIINDKEMTVTINNDIFNYLDISFYKRNSNMYGLYTSSSEKYNFTLHPDQPEDAYIEIKLLP